ncbi:MAG: hypothetical protein JRI55_31580 [Deltaproteobacteria bacterium]|nr:hypothetical protein [Deltaproteobacteria bacterium]
MLVKLDLQAFAPIGNPIDIGQPATGLTLDPRDEAPLLALPCEGKIARVQDNKVTTVLENLGPVFDMAVAQRSLVVVATFDPGGDEPLRGQAITIARTDSEFPRDNELAALRRTFELPGIAVRLTSDASLEGHLLWISPPKEAAVYNVEISPDGQRAMLLLQARYTSDMTLVELTRPCVYRTEIIGTSYLLVDLETDQVLLNRFTKLDFDECVASCVYHAGRPLIGELCSTALTAVLRDRGQLTAPEFDARSATLLFAGN